MIGIVLKEVDPSIYFPFLSTGRIESNPARQKLKFNWKNVQISPDPENPLGILISNTQREYNFPKSQIYQNSKKYKIAYLIMVHENLECISKLMDALYSNDAIYLFHIDSNADQDFKKEMIQGVKNLKYRNVYIMDKSFHGQWGGASLVFIELEGFYQLLDLADWDYVINLSAYDYPLANTSTIHQILEKTPQKSHIGNWNGDPETMRRMSYTSVVSKSKKEMIIDFRQTRLFPWVSRFLIKKQSQWMVRDFK